MLKLATLLLFVVATEAAFSCINTPISSVTLGGNLPTGENGPVLVPKGTNCSYLFNIPNGFALKLSLSAVFNADADKISVTDNLGVVRSLTHTNAPIQDVVIWVSASSASITVLGATGTSTFFAQYTFMSLATFTRKATVNTGNYFALNDLYGAQYYTIASAKKDKVIATVGRRAGTAVEAALDNFYVYDGNDIINSKYIGRLSELGMTIKKSSSGSSLSFVNFYGSRSNSYLLGNDASALANLKNYAVIVSSLGSGVQSNVTSISSTVAVTFICTDCGNFYINQLDFDSFGTVANMGFVTYRGMSPTHGMEKLIKYEPMTFTDSQLPQKIPTTMITMDVYMSTVNVVTSNGNDETRWKTAVDGRKGYVFSPNLWNPFTTNIRYSERFQNDTLFSYKLNLDKLAFKTSSDSLRVQIGPTSGNPSLDNTYPKTSSSNGVVSSTGNFMQLDFFGSAGSDVRVSFEMKVYKSASTIGVLASLIVTMCYAL